MTFTKCGACPRLIVDHTSEELNACIDKMYPSVPRETVSVSDELSLDNTLNYYYW